MQVLSDLNSDLNTLFKYIQERYPTDTTFKHFEHTYKNIHEPRLIEQFNLQEQQISEMKKELDEQKQQQQKHQKQQNPQPSTSKTEKEKKHDTKKKIDDKKQMIKEKLRNSYSEDKRITGEYVPNTTTTETCLDSFKCLKLLIESDKRNILLNSAHQGFVLDKLKTEKVPFLKLLEERKIKISLSHSNFLIRLYKLVEAHSNLLKCNIEIRFISQNYKLLKEVLKEIW